MEPTRVTLVPHTHWDREWYMPFEGFRELLVQMMDTLIDLLDSGFPHFHLDGQTAMIDDYLEVRPEREADIRRLAAQGKISVGPWVTQMDEFLASGESLVRNLERGLERARELGATGPPIGYLPDQFGHVGQMPQILASAGLDRAVVWRGVPQEIERTAFWWESPDGSRVLAEYMPFSYGLGGTFRDAQDPADLAMRIKAALGGLKDMAARPGHLIMVGADHHGPDPELPDRLKGAREVAPDLDVHVGALAEHLALEPNRDLPTWRGELRSSARAHLLPNVYSNRASQKRERARVEALLERYAEPMAALVPGFEWPEKELDRAWQLMLWNGAHDSACGCSVDEVARAVDARHAEASAIAQGIVDRALKELGRQAREAGTLRFNPSPFERDSVPGLGYRVEPVAQEPAAKPIHLSRDGDWIDAGGFRFRLLDEPDVGDLYNFCPADHAKPLGPRRLEVAGDTIAADFGRDLTVRLTVSAREGEPFVRLDGTIDNRRPDHRLRLHLALPEEATGAVAGSPFELVERGLVSEGSHIEPPSPTWPARGVVMASNVAVLAEGVFEYEVAGGRELAITLQRSVGTISRQTMATRPWPAGPDIATPEAQMIGAMEFSFAVLPNARRGDLTDAWERFALPLVSAEATGGGTLSPQASLLEVENAEVSSVRRRNGGLEVRVWNSGAEPTQARVGEEQITLGPAQVLAVVAAVPAK